MSKVKSPNKRLFQMYEKRARQWGERYMMSQRWRIAGMYDTNDIRQDVFAVYLQTFRKYPGKSEEDLFKIFKVRLRGRVNNRSRQCFPNTYAYVAERGKLVIEIDETRLSSVPDGSIEDYLTEFSDVFAKLPCELVDVLKLLIRDFCGSPCIEQRKGKRLSGRGRTEPLSIAIARKLGLDLSRDVLEELDTALSETVNHK